MARVRNYLQYGCGWWAPKGWRNFDASPTLRFERLPLIGWLYTRNSQRFPENVEYGDIVKGLPDLEHMVNRYIDDRSESAAHTFMTDTGLGALKRDRSLRGFVVSYMGNSKHLWMWDFKSIAAELSRAGFTGIRRAAFGDSPDAAFSEVEEKDRWENCLGVECRRLA